MVNVSRLNQAIGFIFLILCCLHLPIQLKDLSFFWGIYWCGHLATIYDRVVDTFVICQSRRLDALEIVRHQYSVPFQHFGHFQEIVDLPNFWRFVERIIGGIGGRVVP